MPFYKCYGCMKTFHSESRVTACKYCHKILSESINRAPNPPRLERRHSAPVLGALTPEQQVRQVQVEGHRPRIHPRCPRSDCYSEDVTCLGADLDGWSKKGKLYACGACTAFFVWDPMIQFDVRFTYRDVGDRMEPLNFVGFRCLGLDTGPVAVRNIFKIGFKAKSDENLVYRTKVHVPIVMGVQDGLESFPRSGDISPESGHCFAGTLTGCTTFPNDVTKTHTYLFICFLRFGYNTHAQQLRDVKAILSHYPKLIGERQSVAWPLHAFEVAVDSVAPEDIWACIPCTKHWATNKWEDGGKFVLDLDGLIVRRSLELTIKQRIRELCEKHATGIIAPTAL
jgi:hypothetical protein